VCVVHLRPYPRALQHAGRLRSDLCGRKKLPFAGYSIVKETGEAHSRQLAAASWWTPLARPASVHIRWLTSPGRHPSGPRLRVPELSILRPLPLARKPCRKVFNRSNRSSHSTALWLPTHLRAPRFRGRAEPQRFVLPQQPRRLARQPKARSHASPGERRLENTGLEPVTSWLQTRRSPS
jgi:hypothetical protein